MSNELKTLYAKVGEEYWAMKKVEYDVDDSDAQAWVAKYNDDTGELLWEEL